MLTLLSGYTRRHAFQINWFASLLGAAGMGYLLFHTLKFALPLSVALVFSMACAKIYVFHVVEGRPIVPQGKPLSYRVAWWICFALLVAW